MIRKRHFQLNTPNARDVISRIAKLESTVGHDDHLRYSLIDGTQFALFRDVPSSYWLFARLFSTMKSRAIHLYGKKDEQVYIKTACPFCEDYNSPTGPFWCTAGMGKLHVYFCLSCRREGLVADALKEKLGCRTKELHHWMNYGIFVDKWYLDMDDILSIPIEYVCRRPHATAALKKYGIKKVKDFVERTQEQLLKIKNFSIIRYREMVKDINDIIDKNVIPGIELRSRSK